MLKSLYLFCFFCLLTPFLQAQELSVHTNFYPSIAYNSTADFGYNGSGYSLQYRQALPKEKLHWTVALETGISGFGSQMISHVGAGYTFVNKPKISFLGELTAINGMALFRPKSLFLVGVSANAVGKWHFAKRLALTTSLGVQYTTVPAYADYGISSYIDIPIRLGLVIQFGSRQSEITD